MSDEFNDEIDVTAPDADQPDNAVEDPGAPDQSEQSSGEESFTDFDPSEIPENGASPEWLKERYSQMQKQWTQKNMDLGDRLRNLEQLQQIVDTIREGDPQTRRATFDLLGMSQQDILEAYELQMAEAEAEEQDDPTGDDPFEFRDPRVDRMEAEKLAEDQSREAEEYADQVGGQMESELKEAFGGKEPSEKASKWMLSYALDNPDQFGRPDVQGAVKEFRELMEEDRQAFLDSRMGPRAATPGVPGYERFDTSTKEGRIAAGQEAARRARSSAQ